MYWLATRNAAVSYPKWRSLARLLRSPVRIYTSFSPSPVLLCSQFERILSFKDLKVANGTTKLTKKLKVVNNELSDKDLSHLMWWKESLGNCRKPSTLHLVKRLVYSNMLGLDVSLKNGSLKEGTLNWEILQFKSRFPREVLLCRVGDFYEAIGIDACILVEYAGLNPFGGLRSDSIPRAGCPVVNLRQTLDDLTSSGYSVCIVEEVQGPTQARSRKGRFISGHAHPGSPYVFGLVGVDHDLDFPEPMPVVGISRSSRGYCIVLVLETMKTYSSEDGLTEEALVTKLRTCRYHHLFLHASLRKNTSGTCRWGEFGEGGLLWGECSARQFEWFEGNPITELFFKVKELYGLDDEVAFRNVDVPSEYRPRPLYLATATQIGAIPTEGIPCLLKVLLPSNCVGLPVLYVRDLLLNPPPYDIASTIQATSKLMSNVTCSIPEFTCVSPAKLVKLLELREANHIEFCRIKNVLDEILHMYRNAELSEILKLLMDPTWVATGLKMDFETFVNECEWALSRIGQTISLDGENDQNTSFFSTIPSEFFEDMESPWKGRVKRMHIKEELEVVEKAAETLSLAVTEDFLPIISRIKATTAPLGGPKGEILYAREHESVWFKGKRFTPAVWARTPGEEQIKQLKHALDSKGRKVGEEWYTTVKVEDALTRYHDAGTKAKARVLELLRELSTELQTKINILVFASTLLVIAKALFAHVSEGKRRKWVFPTLSGFSRSKDLSPLDGANGMKIVGLSPYWFDVAEGSAIHNTVDMQSLFLLTGPNGGGKSSLLRSICAASLLGICGFMVPAESALIPSFDAIMLHMKSYDSPADGKSSFQVEMSEMRSIITGASSRSLVLVDEICRGTETAKGTCIAGSIVEILDKIGCLGIVSTHLHGIFMLPLTTKNTVYKAMGTEYVDGQTKPTWQLIDGICRESLAFETAKREGIPEVLIQRAEDLYLSVYGNELHSGRINTRLEQFFSDTIVNGSEEAQLELSRSGAGVANHKTQLWSTMEILQKELESAITDICQMKLIELYKQKNVTENAVIQCVTIAAREQPPPSTVGASSVYVMLRPDKKLYIGQTDDLEGRIRAHRLKEGMQKASFLYFLVQGKSLACQLETLLINQLPNQGFKLANVGDGKHRNFGTSGFPLESVTLCK
ncbi:MutS_V domain-containing protein/GIY-YIG domain-containing protein/MutS_I domain-containing protein [Cephalotus follicularis]|uniref:MutS_V domain-containing protein/GIY-YIG domain-containing protein/MutS_I domain-containing protein n=1 Tax=Cephalotus follicularis TaxID=3775 RepID=A0A1Q3B2Z6_CEPFO|nr:MutS_V domain-containing protein/GIY-YIG domain-containing protein/MutS_I domain-containing protein [Cephalotus follicularis]